jgi:lipoate-protein ligase B
VAVRTLAVYGIKAGTNDKAAGVWVGDKKIASLGIKVSSGITMHSLSLNVNCDLRYFDPILACGSKASPCCMKKLLGYEVDMEDVTELLILNFGKIFQRKMKEEKLPRWKSEL